MVCTECLETKKNVQDTISSERVSVVVLLEGSYQYILKSMEYKEVN